MTASRRLRIHHELLLLALHDKKGTLAFGQMQGVGMAGGLFAELLFEERITIVEETRRRKAKQLVQVVDSSRFGEAVMDEGLAELDQSKRRLSPKDAVGRVAAIRRLRHKVARELAHMGVLRATEDQILLFFKRKVYPTVDPGPERELTDRIRGVLEGGAAPDDRTALLLMLARDTHTLRALYDRKELKSLKPRLEELSTRAGEAGDAAAEAIRAAQAATMAAITVATATSAGG